MKTKPQTTGIDAVDCILFGFLAISVAAIGVFAFQYLSQGDINQVKNFWRGTERTRGKKYELAIPLELAYTGGTFNIKSQRQKICEVCHGAGSEHPEDATKCPKCKGRGYRMMTRSMGPFQMQQEEPCDHCGGQGTIFKKKCPKCGGKKHYHGEDELVLRVPAGMPEGFQFIFPESSDELVGYSPGDIQVFVSTERNSQFERKGADLWTKVTIPLLDALVGCKITLKHLDGHPVTYQKQNVSYHGEVISIPNEGMPYMDSNLKRGNLYIKLQLEFPDYFTSEQKEELKTLLNEEGSRST